MTYKTPKVFDCQDMPVELRERLRELYNHPHNDTFWWWTINDTVNPAPTVQAVDAWLIENGAEAPIDDDHEGERVLLLFWW